MLTTSPRARFDAAAEALAAGLARAVDHPDHAVALERHVTELGDDGTGLGAVRVLGADVLAPWALTVSGQGPTHDDIDVVRAAVRAFPAPPSAPDPDPVWAARDWALRGVLARLGVDTSGWEGLCPEPEGEDATRPDPPGTGRTVGAEPWPAWSVAIARLSSLALPDLRGTTRADTVARRADLARGMARSMLRRDHLTAARLARWLALDHTAHPEPLLPAALEHLALLAAGAPRPALELAIARRLTEPEP